MSRIRAKNTRPEMVVRSLVHGLGYRFRLHRKDLPGRPDLVFPGLKKIVFVHGCFWHMHVCKYGRVVPATNPAFWSRKRTGNVERDRKTDRALRKAGWRVLTIWECQLRNLSRLERRIGFFLKKQQDGHVDNN
jgi:DNA mismatch endonuclease, patch repair protein